VFLLGLHVFSPQLLFLRSNLIYIISFTVFVIFCSWNTLVESVFMAFRSAGDILIKNTIISILKLMLPFALIAFTAYGVFAYTASMIQNMLLIIPLATTQALLTEGSYNEAELKKHVKKAIIAIVVILIPATLVIVFAGNILLQFFGKSYAAEAFPFLQLYSVS